MPGTPEFVEKLRLSSDEDRKALLQAEFDLLLPQMLKVFEGGPPELADQVKNGMMRHFESPPVTELEVVLKRGLSQDQVKQKLFFPTEEDMADFAVQICAPLGSGGPQVKVQRISLVLMYLAHRFHWKLMRPFILAGGLVELVGLFEIEELQLRSQAMDIFYSLTNCEFFDWFAPVPVPDPDVHKKMIELSTTDVVKCLIANRDASFPGGTLCALQILAFWLSWVRMFYAQDQQLRLSQKILDALQVWTTLEGVSDEEKELASKLYGDFSRLPALEEDGEDVKEFHKQFTDAPVKLGENTAPQSVDMDTDAGSQKARGNAAVAKGKFHEAVDCYTRAIELKDDDPVFYGNRSLAYTRLAGEASDNATKEELLEKAVGDCDKACSLDAKYMKAFYRKAQALVELARFSEAATAIAAASALAPDLEDVKTLSERIASLNVTTEEAKDVQVSTTKGGEVENFEEVVEVEKSSKAGKSDKVEEVKGGDQTTKHEAKASAVETPPLVIEGFPGFAAIRSSVDSASDSIVRAKAAEDKCVHYEDCVKSCDEAINALRLLQSHARGKLGRTDVEASVAKNAPSVPEPSQLTPDHKSQAYYEDMD